METEEKKYQKVDLERVLKEKNPKLARAIPSFIIRYLKRVIHQDDLNRLLNENGHLRDGEFVRASLKHLGTEYTVIGRENIPPPGKRYIFASNHPLGGLDGLVFMDELMQHYDSVKFPVNDILMNLDQLSAIFLPINKHGSQGREIARLFDEAYASSSQILYFPAGICSRKRKGVITDLKWQKSFINKAIQHKRDIVPAYFSGRNSNFFYNLANFREKIGVKSNIEMLYLVDEMFNQKSKKINTCFWTAHPLGNF